MLRMVASTDSNFETIDSSWVEAGGLPVTSNQLAPPSTDHCHFVADSTPLIKHVMGVVLSVLIPVAANVLPVALFEHIW
jgi:hypothetical protein